MMPDPTRLLSTQRFNIGSGAAIFGCGSVEKIAGLIAGMALRRIFVVTDHGVAAAGISRTIEQHLATAGLDVATFAGVRSNPTIDDIEAGGRAAVDWRAEVLVAVGGGSVLDVGKGVALMAANLPATGDSRAGCDFDYQRKPAHPGLPLIAIPTTAGTGSETNGFGVIEDTATRHKFYIGDNSVVPRSVILDPELTRALPPQPTAAAGIDVLAHAIESISSPRSNPYSEALALQCIGMASRFLARAVADGQDIEARAQMLLAAHMAGLAFATTGLGLAHAVAHTLSAQVGAAHGVALAVLLPHVLSFNLPVAAGAYAQMAQQLSVHNPRSDDPTNAEAAVAAVRRLALEVGMPASLSELGCTEALIPALVDGALIDEVVVNTPRMPTSEELAMMLHRAS